MKLLEALKPYENDQLVKVGSEVSYFYVGTVGNLRVGINAVNNAAKQHTANMLQIAQRRLVATIKNEPSPEKYAARELEKDNPDLSTTGYLSALDHYFKAIQKTKKSIETWKDRLDNFQLISDRNVKSCEIGETPVDEGVVRVVLDGYEVGAYWTTDEAASLPSVKFFGGERKEEEE